MGLTYIGDAKFSGNPYLTKADKVFFQKLREAGAISIFRCQVCGNREGGCKEVIPQSKQYCSERCWVEETERRNAKDQGPIQGT